MRSGLREAGSAGGASAPRGARAAGSFSVERAPEASFSTFLVSYLLVQVQGVVRAAATCTYCPTKGLAARHTPASSKAASRGRRTKCLRPAAAHRVVGPRLSALLPPPECRAVRRCRGVVSVTVGFHTHTELLEVSQARRSFQMPFRCDVKPKCLFGGIMSVKAVAPQLAVCLALYRANSGMNPPGGHRTATNHPDRVPNAGPRGTRVSVVGPWSSAHGRTAGTGIATKSAKKTA